MMNLKRCATLRGTLLPRLMSGELRVGGGRKKCGGGAAMTQSARWHALAREAGLAAEHMAIGVTALGKANYAQHAYYGQAFFALSTGFERSAKLALLVDYALENNGKFPPNKYITKDGHDLRTLLVKVDAIAMRHNLSDDWGRLPHSKIHDGIIDTLTNFATNVTRYYNLDLVTDSAKEDDPIKTWFEKVSLPVLEKHYTERSREHHTEHALLMEELLGDYAKIRFQNELGDEVDSIFDGSMLASMTESAIPFTRMYVMQICRFLGLLLSELGRAAMPDFKEIPYFNDFFKIYYNDDKYFKGRKTWSIYSP